MIRSALAVVPNAGKYVCAVVRENGTVDLKVSPDWKVLLGDLLKDERQRAAFRVLSVPTALKPVSEEEPSYFVWDQSWSKDDQDFWLEFLRRAMKEGKVKLPAALMAELNLLTQVVSSRGAVAKTESAKKAVRWSLSPIDREPKFSKLYATLQGFKAVGLLQKAGPKNVKSQAREIQAKAG